MNASETIDNLLTRLSDVPGRIAAAAAKLSEADRQTAASSGEWSAPQILAHLRASDDIVAYRLYVILVRDNPLLPAYDERRWAEVVGYAEADFELSLKTYALRRAELVKMLRQVVPHDWGRLGAHEVRGAVSLLDVAITLVEHDEEHCLQLEAIHK